MNEELVRETYEAYVAGVAPDCRVLLKKFRPVDVGLKVVGVGSVGTRCWILLLEGRDRNDPLFLQMKEATHSVLAEYLRPSPYENHGRRVVEGQRLMQTANDIFLGWTHTPETGHDYYWRQLRDWKGSVDIDSLNAADLKGYARLCGWTLAPRARPLGRPGRHRRLPGLERHVRSGPDRVRRTLCRPERARLRGFPGRDSKRTTGGGDQSRPDSRIARDDTAKGDKVMATVHSAGQRSHRPGLLKRYLPILQWLPGYQLLWRKCWAKIVFIIP